MFSSQVTRNKTQDHFCLLEEEMRAVRSKIFTSGFKPNSHVLWSVSYESQFGDEIVEVAKAIACCPELTRVTLNLADDLERFNFLALIIKNLYSQNRQEEVIDEDGNLFQEIVWGVNQLLDECDDLSEEVLVENLKSLADKCKPFVRKRAAVWLEKPEHKNALELLSGQNLAIVRWEEFISLPEFNKVYLELEQMYDNKDKTLRCIDGEVESRFKKVYIGVTGSHKKLIRLLIRSYLLEESAMRIAVGTTEQFCFDYETYFGTLTQSIRDSYKKLGNSQRMKLVLIKDKSQKDLWRETKDSLTKQSPLLPVNGIGFFDSMNSLRTPPGLAVLTKVLAIGFAAVGKDFSVDAVEPREIGPALHITKQNHCWKLDAHIVAADISSLNFAIDELIEQIKIAKEEYVSKPLSETDKPIEPRIYLSSRQYGGQICSYNITITSYIDLAKVDPFAILIEELNKDKIKNCRQHEELPSIDI